MPGSKTAARVTQNREEHRLGKQPFKMLEPQGLPVTAEISLIILEGYDQSDIGIYLKIRKYKNPGRIMR